MFEPLSKIIEQKRFNWSKEKIVQNQRVFSGWEKCILDTYGPQMINLVKPYLFKNQKLIIQARNSIIACEVQAKKEKIKNEINKWMGEKRVKEIIIRVS